MNVPGHLVRCIGYGTDLIRIVIVHATLFLEFV